MEHTIQIDFHGEKIIVVVKNGLPYIALKPISDSLGLAWPRQFTSLKKDIVLSTCITVWVTQVGAQKRNDEVLGTCVSHKNTQVGAQKRSNEVLSSTVDLKATVDSGDGKRRKMVIEEKGIAKLAIPSALERNQDLPTCVTTIVTQVSGCFKIIREAA
ncbi:MAG: phage antirepressor N-terminal domain-containing protein [Victivallaceae bacterium]|nr:phage antirepressor N-terminal domain-containing protein [Victivallaceae bacterium]